MRETVKTQASELHKHLKKSHRNKIFKNLSNDCGVSIPIGEASNDLFSEEHQKNIDEFLERELGRDSLARYIYAESARKHKIAQRVGVRQVRHCPLTIRLGILVCGKME